MQSNYKSLAPYIREISQKNKGLQVENLLGVSITKTFIPSIANTVGTDMSKYKIVRTQQFAYGPVTSRNGERISIALLKQADCIISTSYTVFEIIDHELLDPEYLMMWFSRPEFDRYARYKSHGSVREIFGWDEMCEVELPIPLVTRQREIVQEYKILLDRISLNQKIIEKLKNTAQTLYRKWFIDFEFPISSEHAAAIDKPEVTGMPYKSSGGRMSFCKILNQEIPVSFELKKLHEVCEILDHQRKPLSKEERKKVQGEYPYYGAISVVDYINDFIFDGVYILFSEDGANVVDENGYPALQYVWGRFWVNNHAHIIKGKNIFSTLYLLQLLTKKKFNHLVTGAAQPKINQKNLKNVDILVGFETLINKFDCLVAYIYDNVRSYTEEIKILEKVSELILARMATA